LPDDLSFDERPYATLAAQHFSTNPTEFVVETEAIALMERLLRHHDRPFGHSSAISTYLVSRLARQQVTMVLNGDWGATVKCVVRRSPLLKLQL
jgi:asparagine synthase (glutamine-hydrolysing)